MNAVGGSMKMYSGKLILSSLQTFRCLSGLNALRLSGSTCQRIATSCFSGTRRPPPRRLPAIRSCYRPFSGICQQHYQSNELVLAFARCNSTSGDQGQGTEKKLPKIYTKTGDKGTSVTIAGDRRPKDDVVFEAVGATDELSSAIGLAREFVRDSNLWSCDRQLEEIQCVLQDAGSNIATPRSLASPNQKQMTEFDGSTVEMLEEWIDEMTVSLPPLRNFILPSGGKSSSAIHVARSICRRAERSIAPLVRNDDIDPAVLRFINRLSDYLFTAARFAAQEEGKKETIYRRIKPKDRKR